MDIRLFQVLPEAERQALFGWGEDLFDVKRYGLQWRLKDWHCVVYEDGAPCANASVLRHEVELGGRPTVIGGLGSVIALPEVRGRGLARRAVGRATELMRDNLGASFGLLFCLPRLLPYYAPLGWRLLEQGVLIDQPDGRIPAPFPVMILPFTDRSWPAEQIDLESLPW